MRTNYDDEYDHFQKSNRFKKLANQKQRRGKHGMRRINGIDKNHEGHEMAGILFAMQFGRFPDETERREYHKNITKSHTNSQTLTQVYEETVSQTYGESFALGDPARIKALLEYELSEGRTGDIELIQKRLQDKGLPITIHTNIRNRCFHQGIECLTLELLYFK